VIQCDIFRHVEKKVHSHLSSSRAIKYAAVDSLATLVLLSANEEKTTPILLHTAGAGFLSLHILFGKQGRKVKIPNEKC
jgi:hypothetical protein